MIKILKYNEVDNGEIFSRAVPDINVEDTVSDIISCVRKNGDSALFEYCEKFDKAKLKKLEVSQDEIDAAMSEVEPRFIEILEKAAKNIEKLRSASKKIIAFEPNISRYNGDESFVGYVRSFDSEIRPGRRIGLELYMKNLWNLRRQKEGDAAPKTGGDEFRSLVKSALECPYGTIFVASTIKTLESFPELSALPLSVGEPACSNLGNCVVLVLSGGDISGYKRIIYLDDPVYTVKKMKSAEVFVGSDISVRAEFPVVDATREGVGEVFAILKNYKGARASSSAALYGAISQEVPEISRYQFIFAAEVLSELGIISFDSGRLHIDRTVRADLNDSAIYRKIGGRN